MKIKKITAYILTTVMIFGIFGVVSVGAANNGDFDGDIITNPWEGLFTDAVTENDSNNPSSNKTNETTKNVQSKATIKKLGRTKILTATKKSKKAKKASVRLYKIRNATGYTIKYSTNSKFKKSKTQTIVVRNTKFVITKLKAGKKYYVKARAIAKVNGKVRYGKWSAKKIIKIKK